MARFTVTIKIGRSGSECHRFGVCEIIFSTKLQLQPNEDLGVLEYEPGASTAKLHFRGNESLTEQGVFAVPIDRAVYLPLPCNGGIDWFARKGRYPVQRDNNGEYIQLELSAVHPVN